MPYSVLHKEEYSPQQSYREWSLPITVHAMGSEHLHAVIEIERQCFIDPWGREAIYHHIDNPLGIGYVACRRQDDGNEIVCGYCCGLSVHDEAMLYRIACLLMYRRQGIASTLLNYFLMDAARRGAVNCYLEVEEANHSAQSFYKRNGFKSIGRRPRYYTESDQDALIMHRTICLY